jgi:hypothetical protein
MCEQHQCKLGNMLSCATSVSEHLSCRLLDSQKVRRLNSSTNQLTIRNTVQHAAN